MKCNGPSSKFVHLQQGKVLIVKSRLRSEHQLYNSETKSVYFLHRIKCNAPKDNFVQLKQGKVLIVINPVAACTSTVQPLNLCRTLPTPQQV